MERDKAEVKREAEGLAVEIHRLMAGRSYLCLVTDLPNDSPFDRDSVQYCGIAASGHDSTLRHLIARVILALGVLPEDLAMDIVAASTADDLLGIETEETPLPKSGSVRPHVRVGKDGKVTPVNGYWKKRGKK